MNTKKEPLEELVEKMLKEQNHNPRDCSFRLITHRYPEESHNAFNFPGKYVNRVKTGVHTEDRKPSYGLCTISNAR